MKKKSLQEKHLTFKSLLSGSRKRSHPSRKLVSSAFFPNAEIVQCLFSLQSFILIVVTCDLSIKDNTVVVLNNALIACDVRSAVSRSSQLFMAPVWEAALTLSPPATSDTAQAMPSFKSKCVTFVYFSRILLY